MLEIPAGRLSLTGTSVFARVAMAMCRQSARLVCPAILAVV